MEERGVKRVHKLALDSRKNCVLSGIKDVISFDLNCVLLETEDGALTIKGEDLHVSKLSVEKGELEVSGLISTLSYSESKDLKSRQESFLAKVFK